MVPDLDTHALTKIVRALADHAAMESVNERARVYGPQSSRTSEPDALTPTEAAIASGVLARGRRIHAVLVALPAEAQDLAAWIEQRAAGLVHGPLATDALALALATTRGPVADRDHLTDAATAEAQRQAVHDEARRARDVIVAVGVSRRRVTHADRIAALQRAEHARDLVRTTGDALRAATVRRVAAEGVLVAWGRERLGVLVTAVAGRHRGEGGDRLRRGASPRNRSTAPRTAAVRNDRTIDVDGTQRRSSAK